MGRRSLSLELLRWNVCPFEEEDNFDSRVKANQYYSTFGPCGLCLCWKVWSFGLFALRELEFTLRHFNVIVCKSICSFCVDWGLSVCFPSRSQKAARASNPLCWSWLAEFASELVLATTIEYTMIRWTASPSRLVPAPASLQPSQIALVQFYLQSYATPPKFPWFNLWPALCNSAKVCSSAQTQRVRGCLDKLGLTTSPIRAN